MVQSIRPIGVGAAALVFLLIGAPASARHHSTFNPSVETVHAPVVSRTDYVLDVRTGPRGLAPGEADRLAGWFEGLNIGYGDVVTLDDPWGRRDHSAREAVGEVLSDYGMLLAQEPGPITIGHPVDGMVRVVVSRATASVEGCPDWSRGNMPEYEGSTMSNFGCATETNIAAMVANPEDLIEGRSNNRPADAMLSVKAIKTYRDADTTGKGGLKSESVKNAVSGGN